MFPAELKSSYPHSQKRKEVKTGLVFGPHGRTDRLTETRRSKGPRTSNILTKVRIKEEKILIQKIMLETQNIIAFFYYSIPVLQLAFTCRITRLFCSKYYARSTQESDFGIEWLFKSNYLL